MVRLPLPGVRRGAASLIPGLGRAVQRFQNRHSRPRADLGMLLGSATLAARMRDGESPPAEASFLAVDRRDQRVLAFGDQARRYDGRSSDQVRLVRPVRGGALADTAAGRRLFEWALGQRRVAFGAHLVVGVSSALTPMERRSIQAAARAAGARRVHLLDQPILAALGAGLPILAPRASMVIDLGAGTCEAAILASGHVLASTARRLGGDAMDEAIRERVRRIHAVEISASSAERLKLELGRATEAGTALLGVPGRDLRTGLPTRVEVHATDVQEALRPVLAEVSEEIRGVLREVSPDALADVSERGAMLTGGVAALPGLAEYLESETGLAMRVSGDPGGAAAQGLDRVLKEPRLRARLLEPQQGSSLRTAAPTSEHRVRARTVALLILAASLLLLLFFGGDLREWQPASVDGSLSGVMVPLWSLAGLTWGDGGRLEQEALGARLETAERQSRQLLAENTRLRELYRAAPRPRGWTLAPASVANVVARSPREWLSSLTVGAGARQGLKPGMVAVTRDGLVGPLVAVAPETSRVRLLVDRQSVAAAAVPSRKATGVLYGMGDGTCELRFLDPDARIREGDLVASSGLDGLYPPGLRIGRVSRVDRLRDEVHQVATVEPSVDFDALREVLLMHKGAGR